MVSKGSIFAALVVVGATQACGASQQTPLNVPLGGARVAACVSDAPAMERAWNEFRATYPQHIQTVALSAPYGEGCRTLILSEPPSRAAIASVGAILPAGASLSARRHPIGYDGWVTDFATVLPPAPAGETTRLVSELHKTLFGTDYKAYVTPVEGVPPSPSGLAVKISPGDISRWLLGGADMTSVLGGDKRSVATVLREQAEGVFFASVPGLVVWALPRPASLDGQMASTRQFALDSDLILGAVASPKEVLILGRERATPIDRVNPLRYETLVTLASTHGHELAQSYERMNVLAGRFDGANDWAPIYLSPELVDGEFGSLLNLADQLLKGDSNDGATSYANFVYPPPLDWPFPKALPVYLKVDTLTYNWNTNGAGAIADNGDVSIYWVRDTGALPVTYLPEGTGTPQAVEAAVAAQRFFSSQEDPLLVRVVQYSALYQIFQAFGVSATAPARDTAADPGRALEDATYDALHKLSESDGDGVQDAIRTQLAREGLAPGKGDGLSDAELGTLMEVLELYGKIHGISEDERDDTLHMLAHALANPDRDLSSVLERLFAGGSVTDADMSKLSGAFLAKDFTAYGTAVKAFVPDLVAVRDRYSTSVCGARDPIIRTPSIVVSSNGGSMKEATGGHNIDAAVPRVRLTSGSPASLVDAKGAASLLRGVSAFDDLGLSPTGVVQRVGKTTPLRTDQVLGLIGTEKAGARGFAPGVADGPTDALTDIRARVHGSRVTLAKTDDGFAITDEAGTTHAGTRVELVEALASRFSTLDDSVVVHGQGLRADELRLLVRSVELKTQRGVIALSEGSESKLAASRLDLSGITMTEPVRTLQDGTAEVTLQVSAKAPERPTFAMRIRMSFSRGVVAKLAGRLNEVVQRAIVRLRSHFGSHTPSVTEAALELHRDLRRIDEQVGITLDAPDQADLAADFILSENDEGRLGASPERAHDAN